MTRDDDDRRGSVPARCSRAPSSRWDAIVPTCRRQTPRDRRPRRRARVPAGRRRRTAGPGAGRAGRPRRAARGAGARATSGRRGRCGAGGALLFSDVPNNVIWRWHESEGVARVPAPERLHRQRAARRRARLERPGRRRRGPPATCASTAIAASRGSAPDGKSFETVADTLRGQALQQPQRSGGAARTATSTSPIRSTASTGTRRIRSARSRGAASTARAPAARVDVLDKTLTFPNGLAFSPDGKTLYVAVSDPARAIWMAYDVDAGGGVANGRVFFDATSFVKAGKKGLPDGMKIDVARQPVRDRPGRRVRVLAGGQAPRHDRHGRADRELRVRRRRLARCT